MKYEVNFTDPSTGATSPIDRITAPAGYTAADYVRDCEENADNEWIEMIKAGTITLVELEDANMKYRVKPEFEDQWFNGEFPEPIDMDEIKRLSVEWEIPVEELMEQVTECEEESEMKIKIEDVAKQLSENVSIEFGESNGHVTATYYLHMDEDGNLDRSGKIDFHADRDVSAYEGDEDASGIYESERLDDETFRAVCEDLTNQANAWIAENL